MDPDIVVDAKGKSCPMPVVMARKGMANIESGQLMALEATDPGSCRDIPAWARDMGHDLIGTDLLDGGYRYLIRKG
ncbi:MAG: sulfurtransferase TusA family protein [Acidimicrobiales bacterium]